MATSDPSSTKKPLEYSRVIINVPTGLLRDFDKVCGLEYYSRPEAIIEAMRNFIGDSLPDDYLSPEQSKEQFSAMWQGMIEAAVNVQEDPKYQALQEKNLFQTQGGSLQLQGLPMTPKMTSTPLPTTESIQAELEKKKSKKKS